MEKDTRAPGTPRQGRLLPSQVAQSANVDPGDGVVRKHKSPSPKSGSRGRSRGRKANLKPAQDRRHQGKGRFDKPGGRSPRSFEKRVTLLEPREAAQRSAGAEAETTRSHSPRRKKPIQTPGHLRGSNPTESVADLAEKVKADQEKAKKFPRGPPGYLKARMEKCATRLAELQRD